MFSVKNGGRKIVSNPELCCCFVFVYEWVRPSTGNHGIPWQIPISKLSTLTVLYPVRSKSTD